ncbi:glycosyltransferase [Clostridium botulinum]|uniref:Glycosyltransferase family 4 protein n=1 Tax=Clostridium botulinum TaxID=1491 RepID=A0AA43Y705_CLOBO|nr:glycosyltransferase family 4 protein [Clostridium botulinum]APH19047.1 glycosyl transferases group 1 family protein [Clostridium botulinum]AUM92204.1 hypothetical protein RSJ5_13300 [Clostridium botulinum]KEI87987.1 hypothetical protein N492_13805 [Clostridium botulinum B2 267]KEJ02808.1 hypothetical protein N496_12845 [Clostridium botulinum A2B3 87]MBY6800463.1 glycosyltransferase family 4 protein [Clostridium botulinum]
MKICMIDLENEMLTARFYWKDANSLSKNEFDVTYITFSKEYEKEYVTEQGIRHIILKHGQIDTEKISSNKFDIITNLNMSTVNKLAKVILKDNYDIYYLNGIYSPQVAKIIKNKNKNKKVIWQLQESYPDYIRDYISTQSFIKNLNKYLYSFYINLYQKYYSTLFDYIIVTDDSIKKYFNPIINGKVVVIYNYSSLEAYGTNDSKEYDLIYCGGITTARGAMSILKAVKIGKEIKSDIKMVFVGPVSEKDLRTKMDRYIMENNLGKNIFFIGSISFDKIGSYLAKSKIGLAPLFPIPKYKKNISMKIFEYMQYGLPIVGSDFGPIKRFLEESNSGVCVNPEDGAEIWKAIKSILEDEKLYMKYSQNGKKAYKNKYNWTKMEENIINIFNNLA